MANKDKPSMKKHSDDISLDDINNRLELFDQRLDNIDSVVSAVVERVMSQPITISTTCPHCGKNLDIALVGNRRPTVSK
ncbi:MAG: hypothetical protein QQM50_01380 [Dehalococcoides mccartyi]|uniref:Uncharacterized protein n=3 Tax=root TaxID=1 RepID=A0A0V8M033_9CHLR|nr:MULTISPECIES: hypothetical protein [Dehalococcoides]AAW39584.1 hypothetical protein DET1185 [Dehalococcoides mccartyi 195]AHB13762.1 hypothetical protein GY50_0989 [Dehalococcoides mccartyi GY50]AII58141.1 hypothetical protein X792_05430 [Dehalococcoides mccartyi CG1]AII59742.1 hypothetical protein X793_05355 [Dehalococcoides mccartyi CG4]APH12729.1 hypothetical protein ASJ33_05970 [Dehalococcoides mccartyi]